ncbi:hypothetical protein NUU61_000086 [Penicillium alfredii]|uniref:Uncharacterized protein n=1 Tax=Penicillium alfredii TaxID=1506179 RepID=A0A9W9G988_9EURO|nr:uncharacterized protein NUU61_000086 [Penicillium alfredii]KAJ5114327.1 hypothetical protein NUU61_000086 [Penicillium alfredii]
MNCDSSTAGSHQTYTAELEESAFLRRSRSLHWARLGLSSLIFIAAIAIIPCEAVPLRHYKSTSEWASVGLALWPLNFDLRPTVAALSCGCVITFLSLMYIVAALLPSPHSRIKPLNTYASLSAFAGFITALVGVLFIIHRPSSSYPAGFTHNETLHSWTCKWKIAPDGAQAPIYFSRDCASTRAGFVLLCVLLALEVLLGLVAAVGAWLQRNVARHREDLVQLEKLDIATKQVFRN